jgi:hypothetical protein
MLDEYVCRNEVCCKSELNDVCWVHTLNQLGFVMDSFVYEDLMQELEYSRDERGRKIVVYGSVSIVGACCSSLFCDNNNELLTGSELAIKKWIVR